MVLLFYFLLFWSSDPNGLILHILNARINIIISNTYNYDFYEMNTYLLYI